MPRLTSDTRGYVLIEIKLFKPDISIGMRPCSFTSGLDELAAANKSNDKDLASAKRINCLLKKSKIFCEDFLRLIHSISPMPGTED